MTSRVITIAIATSAGGLGAGCSTTRCPDDIVQPWGLILSCAPNDQPRTVQIRPGGHRELWVNTGTGHFLGGYPEVKWADTNKQLYLREIVEMTDWGSTYLIRNPRVHCPFSEPTNKRYVYLLSFCEGAARSNEARTISVRWVSAAEQAQVQADARESVASPEQTP
jgi:hypothetical protein